ncbi:histone deacetylase 7-like [Chanos chanos]|uniref:Histone deacetylase 7-like n=1 Tax=Chanos chanos TaxID=29144 RepID=A0A6J2VQS1_CHACN|nr:histone deacetylase 7-like [Chanos chanos]
MIFERMERDLGRDLNMYVHPAPAEYTKNSPCCHTVTRYLRRTASEPILKVKPKRNLITRPNPLQRKTSAPPSFRCGDSDSLVPDITSNSGSPESWSSSPTEDQSDTGGSNEVAIEDWSTGPVAMISSPLTHFPVETPPLSPQLQPVLLLGQSGLVPLGKALNPQLPPGRRRAAHGSCSWCYGPDWQIFHP